MVKLQFDSPHEVPHPWTNSRPQAMRGEGLSEVADVRRPISIVN